MKIQYSSFTSHINSILPTEASIERYFDRLWPICRGITGQGLRTSLNLLKELIPLDLVEVPTGQKVLDWTIPKEWHIDDAYIEDPQGQRFAEFSKNNLHILHYSTPVDTYVELEELQNHLFSLPEMPDAIPYRTTYYQERWGFCLEDRIRKNLKTGRYRVVIKSKLFSGSLTYGHCQLPSQVQNSKHSKKEVLLSTYLCHPSLANNELSGPLVTAFLYDCLKKIPNLKYTYRFVIVPETIGAIAYLSAHGLQMKENCIAGYVLTCCGDDKDINYKKSRRGQSLTDRCTENVLSSYARETAKTYQIHEFFPTGSDERQYCSPGYDLPVGSLIRSMYGCYPEYHTSLDNKSFISWSALRETIMLYLRAILSIEANEIFINTSPFGEPMLGPRGLYPSVGAALDTESIVSNMMYLLNYADGTHDLCSIAEKAGCSVLELAALAHPLLEKGLLVRKDSGDA